MSTGIVFRFKMHLESVNPLVTVLILHKNLLTNTTSEWRKTKTFHSHSLKSFWDQDGGRLGQRHSGELAKCAKDEG